jgi:hypothetical protein
MRSTAAATATGLFGGQLLVPFDFEGAEQRTLGEPERQAHAAFETFGINLDVLEGPQFEEGAHVPGDLLGVVWRSLAAADAGADGGHFDHSGADDDYFTDLGQG